MGLKKRSKINAEFNMSSLTDIIFLLLIFFMLTSSSASSNILNLRLPQSEQTLPSPQTFTVSITSKMQYFVAEQQIEYPQLESALLRKVNEERAKARKNGEDGKEITAVLNVDQDVQTADIVDVMKIANNAGVRLILATQPRK